MIPRAPSERIARAAGGGKSGQDHYIVLDCDNTFGLPGLPVDDGLALIYLLGKPGVHLLGVATTHGNAPVETVYQNTLKMMGELGRTDIPVLRGGGLNGGARPSGAAQFLVKTAKRYDGNLTVLAVGALTNLRDASDLDADFFHRLKEVVLMGGITGPLFPGGVPMDELNFSCDSEGSFQVLSKGERISIATGNNCLAAYMDHESYRARLLKGDMPIGSWLYAHTRSWFETKILRYGLNGFYNWDAVAAVYATEKRLFSDHPCRFHMTKETLKNGYIGGRETPLNGRANLPTLRDPEAFAEELFESWRRVRFGPGG